MKDKVIILGDSPFIESIENVLQYVLSRYYTIGINRIIKKYEVNAHIFADIGIVPITMSYPNIKTITLESYNDLIRKPNKELINTFTYKEDMPIVSNNRLAWCGFTHDYAISYCISKGIKDIVLIGAADFSNNGHYSEKVDFIHSEKLKKQSMNFIEKECCKHANIVTCNPDSALNIPKISINELLV